MQPSELEIQREVEALRDIRRRSTAQGGPGSLILDPDLPNEASQAQSAYWSPTDDSSSSSHDSHSDNSNSSVPAQDDPFHLFWVPARVHPELAPREFREFLKEHTRPSPDSTAATTLGRSNSVSSMSLDRKRSMLSRQYKPSANDGVGEAEEKVVPLRRNRSSYSYVPQLTIDDLQKLEELAEEASKSDDPSRLRNVLRRSLSLNIAPSVIDQDDLKDLGDDVDAPIIVPLPGQVLKRTARTKIRKSGTGEGAHRFTATRSRRKSIGRAATVEPRTSSDLSSSDHGEAETIRRVARLSDVSDVPPLPRPESYSLEAAIYEAYAQQESDRELATEPPVLSRSPDIVTEPISEEPIVGDGEPEPEPEPSPIPTGPIIYQPQPQRALTSPSTSDSPRIQRTPSPSARSSDLSPSPPNSDTLHQARPSLQGGSTYHPPSPSPSDHRREKDKRGLFGKWGGGDKSGKKQKDKATEREKEKDTSFFGSFFGSKKKPEDQSPSSTAAGRETATALLGASKLSKNYVPPPSPQLGMYARYPIHVERAIYRLSHIKLANPRRPLYEQVLISNLMFWYLGVINKTGQNQGPGQGPNATAGASGAQTEDDMPSSVDRERAEREQEERAEKEREKQEKKDGQRRGSLTKPAPSGSPSRRAETPVRGPQYEMQHRAMEQGYGGYPQLPNGGPPAMRTSSAAPPLMNAPHHRSQSSQSSQFSVQLVQPQTRNSNSLGSTSNQYYDIGESSQLSPQQYSGTSQLPPGAMPPAAAEQTWMSHSGVSTKSTSPPPRQGSPPSTPPPSGSRRPRSPPQANRYSPQQRQQDGGGGGRAPGRSLSATATPSQPMAPLNGKVKKVMSAHATPPRQSSEDEDVPLAVWQQQQRRKEL